jgi:type I restriction enzyme S subunit
VTTLSSLCDLIVDCEHRTAPTAASGYPLIRTPDVGVGRLHVERAQRVDEATYTAWTKREVPREGDLILAREAPVGNVGIVPPGVHPVLGQRTVLIRPRPDALDPYYLNYLLSGPELRGWMESVSTGVTVPHLNMADIRSMELPPLPPLPTQRKIAAILSAYDALIENNNRRIKLLEEMAQRIYREWFVDFRYPGHEDVSLVDSELGPIPKGWQIAPFTDLADILSGGTPRTTVPEYWDGVIPFFTPRDAPDSLVVATTEKHISQVGLERCNSQLYPRGTIFITARGTVGKVVMAGVPMAMNQSCYAIRGREELRQEFLLFAVRNQVDYLRTNTGGATFDTIIVDTFRRMRSILPPHKHIGAFAGVVEPAIRLIAVLQDESENIRNTRDLLVPRLISGEIDVTDLDISMPEAAA